MGTSVEFVMEDHTLFHQMNQEISQIQEKLEVLNELLNTD